MHMSGCGVSTKGRDLPFGNIVELTAEAWGRAEIIPSTLVVCSRKNAHSSRPDRVIC